MENSVCLQLRERFFELLIEPETAPPDLVQQWQGHRENCSECVEVFCQWQQQQSVGDTLLQNLLEELPTPTLSFQQKTQRPLWPGFLLAASLLLAIGLGFFAGRASERQAILVASTPKAIHKQKIAQALRQVSLESDQHLDEQQFEALLADVCDYAIKIRSEFIALRNLAKEQRKKPQSRTILFLRPRLMLHCRLILVGNSWSKDLEYIEAHNYEKARVKEVFNNAIYNIGRTEAERRSIASFFQKAAPHLLQIMRYKQGVLARIHGDNSENAEQTEGELINLIENFEEQEF